MKTAKKILVLAMSVVFIISGSLNVMAGYTGRKTVWVNKNEGVYYYCWNSLTVDQGKAETILTSSNPEKYEKFVYIDVNATENVTGIARGIYLKKLVPIGNSEKRASVTARFTSVTPNYGYSNHYVKDSKDTYEATEYYNYGNKVGMKMEL